MLLSLRYAASQKDPIQFVNAEPKRESGEGDVFAWKMFKSVVKV